MLFPLQLNIGNSFHLDGVIENRGTDATNSGGGGSGGSVLIQTVMFSGHGKIHADGGRGHGSGGAGAGGRVAVHVSWLREYAGEITFVRFPCFRRLILE